MKEMQFWRMIGSIMCNLFYFIIFAIFINFPGLCEANGDQNSVYIDPLYGGEELGPYLTNEYQAKSVALNIAKTIKSNIESDKIHVELSRNEDKTISTNDRLLKGIYDTKNIVLYVAIDTCQGEKNCLYVYYPDFYKEKPEDKGDRLFLMIERKMKERLTDESIKMANELKNNIGKFNCIEIEPRKNYLLEHTEIPTIIISFQFGKSQLGDKNFIKNYVNSDLIGTISRSIAGYVTSFKRVSRVPTKKP